MQYCKKLQLLINFQFLLIAFSKYKNLFLYFYRSKLNFQSNSFLYHNCPFETIKGQSKLLV